MQIIEVGYTQNDKVVVLWHPWIIGVLAQTIEQQSKNQNSVLVSQHAGLHCEHVPIFRIAEVPDFRNYLS